MLVDHSSAAQASNSLLIFPSTLAVAAYVGVLFLCALLAIGFILLRQKMRSIAMQLTGHASAASLALELQAQALLVRQMSRDLEELKKRLLEQNERMPTTLPLWSSAEVPVNLNRRGQIIRLSRKGKSIPEIAHDLNVAQGEVELLLKVHDLSQNKPKQN